MNFIPATATCLTKFTMGLYKFDNTFSVVLTWNFLHTRGTLFTCQNDEVLTKSCHGSLYDVLFRSVLFHSCAVRKHAPPPPPAVISNLAQLL